MQIDMSTPVVERLTLEGFKNLDRFFRQQFSNSALCDAVWHAASGARFTLVHVAEMLGVDVENDKKEAFLFCNDVSEDLRIACQHPGDIKDCNMNILRCVHSTLYDLYEEKTRGIHVDHGVVAKRRHVDSNPW